ncbi:MAG: hypothetical protein AAB393_14935 [Bacteroidota bacterium]
MKKIVFAAMLAFASLAFFAFTALERSTSDVLKQLGIPEAVAKDCIWSSFSGGYFSYRGDPEIRRTPAGKRAAATSEIAAFARAFTQSAEFKRRYLEYRESMKPIPPEAPKSMAEMRRSQKEELQKNIRETEQTMKTMPADQQATMKGVIAMWKEQLKSIDDPNNPMYSAQMDEMQKQSYAMQMEEHKNKLAEWEKNYPTSPNTMIKRWLTEFLEVSKDVDFNAALTSNGQGKKMFVRSDYENKPANWKMCYRAGKETVGAGRAFAKQWLDDLNKTK